MVAGVTDGGEDGNSRLKEDYVMVNGGKNMNRREFLRQSSAASAAFTIGMTAGGGCSGKSKAVGKKVIVLGIDGMDPRLAERMMNSGQLPNFDKLRKAGGYRRLGTSTPPQSPVAWANFINGAGPGSHGLFDFIQRNPKNPREIFSPISRTTAGSGVAVGKHVLPVFKQPKTVLQRQGVPFWEYLDKESIPSVVYMVPSNYPPSRSRYGHHRSISGMGTPNVLGKTNMYQYFSEDRMKPAPAEVAEDRGRLVHLVFEKESAKTTLQGPVNHFLTVRENSSIDFSIHRDRNAEAAVVEIQGQRVILKPGQWSGWLEVDFSLGMPEFMPDVHVNGMCRMYLKSISPKLNLYVGPINIDPSDPSTRISEPEDFVEKVSKELGQFYTAGFQEDYKARNERVLTDAEYASQTEMVLQTRLKMLDYALKYYDDGLLFFYFSSADLQSHIFWWDSMDRHPYRSSSEARKYHNHIKTIYKRMDDVLGDVLDRYKEATVFVLSDHGFSTYTRSFNLNAWLRDNGYIKPSYCTHLFSPAGGSGVVGADWDKTVAYGIGLNGLYLNLAGREKNGVVTAQQREGLLAELTSKLESLRDTNGSRVIRKVYRSDEIYSGLAMEDAPDLIVGPFRGYRISNASTTGHVSPEVLHDNTSPWNADHCFDPREVPGVLFCNRSIEAEEPNLIDLAPSILAEYGLGRPCTMEGKNIFESG